jgi:hypothetical protein
LTTVIAVRISLSGSLTPVIVGGEYDLRQSDPDILLPLKIRDLIVSDYSDEASVQDLIEHYESFGSVYAIHLFALHSFLQEPC